MRSLRLFKNLSAKNLWQPFRKFKTFGKVAFKQNMKLLPLLLAVPVLAWLLPLEPAKNQGDFSPDKINLALRRTADGLLRASGDSTSRIPAIEQVGSNVWRVRLEQPFLYEALPGLLQSSLKLHGINRPYEVAVRRCDDATIDLGYHQLDYVQNNVVACGGREMPDGCHFIEIRFSEKEQKWPFLAGKIGVSLLILSGLGYWFFRRQNPVPVVVNARQEGSAGGGSEMDSLEFGQSSLDVAGQVLICGGVRQTLTFRETKLLRLFAASPDRLLERDYILQQVWADEGVLVGRSVDVFVSRLRKKLAGDSSVSIVAVHGVGYRLETGRVG